MKLWMKQYIQWITQQMPALLDTTPLTCQLTWSGWRWCLTCCWSGPSWPSSSCSRGETNMLGGEPIDTNISRRETGDITMLGGKKKDRRHHNFRRRKVRHQHVKRRDRRHHNVRRKDNRHQHVKRRDRRQPPGGNLVPPQLALVGDSQAGQGYGHL